MTRTKVVIHHQLFILILYLKIHILWERNMRRSHTLVTCRCQDLVQVLRLQKGFVSIDYVNSDKCPTTQLCICVGRATADTFPHGLRLHSASIWKLQWQDQAGFFCGHFRQPISNWQFTVLLILLVFKKYRLFPRNAVGTVKVGAAMLGWKHARSRKSQEWSSALNYHPLFVNLFSIVILRIPHSAPWTEFKNNNNRTINDHPLLFFRI